jgi:hypothetical protein
MTTAIESYIAEMSDYVRAIKDAPSRDVMGVVYLHLVGHDIAQDDPSMTLEAMQELALDYIIESCNDADINPLDVGIGDDVSDESRSYGPRQ